MTPAGRAGGGRRPPCARRCQRATIRRPKAGVTVMVTSGRPALEVHRHRMHHPPLEIPRLRALARHALPNLVEASVVPLVVFYGALWLVGVWGGLLAALAWSYVAIGRRLVTGKPLPGLLVLGALGLTTRTFVAAMSGSVFVYFLQPTLTTVLIAGFFLASVPAGPPIAGRLAPGGGALDQPAVGHERAGTVHGQRAGDPVAAAVEGDEAALLGGAVDHPHLVGARRPARELDLAVVLVGPEPRHGVIRLVASRPVARQQASGRVLAHGDGVVPVLDPHQFGEPPARPARHVAGGHHAGSSQGGGVADDAVVERQARALEPAGVGRDPDADDHEVGIDRRAVCQPHPLDPPLAAAAGVSGVSGVESCHRGA